MNGYLKNARLHSTLIRHGPSLRSATGADGELVSGNWHSGNAEEDGREYHDSILGHFIDPAEA
jgi:hypothetical protein